MLVNINVFLCFTAAMVIICINTSVHQIERDCIIVTSTTQLQRHYVIAATTNSTATRQYDVNKLLECQSRRTTSTRQCNIKTPLERQGISTKPTRHALLTI